MSEFAPNHERRISDGLDFYKLTMGQMALKFHPDLDVTFTLKNRSERTLSEYVDITALKNRFATIRDQGFESEEIAYFAGLKASSGEARFDPDYLDYLSDLTLTDVDVALDDETGDLAISATGPWANVSLWETVVMSEINELYYQSYIEKNNLDINKLFAEGDRRLDEKIALLSMRPDIKFSDFGTRRRFSAEWHEHVVGRLADELPDNFIGTSNPWYAYKFNIKPIGTYAHEMPMVYAALSDQETGQPLAGHRQMMERWYDHHDQDLTIALTDTFTSDFFFADFTPEQARHWNGLRHDSGDPIEFGERAIAFYTKNNIDPTTKTIVFSDGLDIKTIIRLAGHFSGRINLIFGWGTSLMNDLGLPANNFVMKATNANGIATVKLSDNIGKHTGPEDKIREYNQQVSEAI